jgi:hypothetical protein
MRAEGFFYPAGDYIWFRERGTDKAVTVLYCRSRRKREKLALQLNNQIEASLSDRERQFMEMFQ